MPHIGWQLWVALGVIALPFLVIGGSLLIKLGWGLWPMPVFLTGAIYGMIRLGLEWFWLIAVALMAGIITTWLWQRSNLFLAGDRWLEKVMMLGD